MKDNVSEVVWMIVSQSPLTPTPSWRGVMVETAARREAVAKLLDVSRHRNSRMVMGRWGDAPHSYCKNLEE